jgi:nicotinamidase-related amidase
VVDLQDAFRKGLHEWDRTLARTRVLIRAAHLLELPVLYTEQYPKGLGATVPEVREVLGDAQRFEKRTLSALGAPGFAEALAGLGRRQAIVAGIETHACINQTVHDLLDGGIGVHLAEDAISARRAFEHAAGLAKMLASGAVGGSVESLLFECLRSADHPAFKPVQALLK